MITTGDAERRRLERDLHDGAQQELVGLALSLRLARARLEPDVDPSLLARIDEADHELHTAIAELREVAHGIFPAVLVDEGLAAALEALAEEVPTPIEIERLPDRRIDASVEAAAYFVASEVIHGRSTSGYTIAAAWSGASLLIEIRGDGPPAELTELEDRVGALAGRLDLVPEADGRITVRAEFPCES